MLGAAVTSGKKIGQHHHLIRYFPDGLVPVLTLGTPPISSMGCCSDIRQENGTPPSQPDPVLITVIVVYFLWALLRLVGIEVLQ